MFTVMFRGMLRGFKHIKRVYRNTDFGNAAGRSRDIPENTHACDCNMTPHKGNKKKIVVCFNTLLLQHQTMRSQSLVQVLLHAGTPGSKFANIFFLSVQLLPCCHSNNASVTPLFGMCALIGNATCSSSTEIFF